MAGRKKQTYEERQAEIQQKLAKQDRLQNAAEWIEKLLGLEEETVMIEGTRWLCLRVEHAEALIAMAERSA
jgi:hypothetical protein